MSWEESQYIIKRIEDTIAKRGKKLAPKAMASCAASGGMEEITLTWTLPTDTVIDGDTLSEIEGVMIRRKIGSAPKDVLDGDLVTVSTDSPGTYVDTGLVGDVTYYYKFFPFSTEGAINVSTTNVASATPAPIPIYAFHDDFTDLNPNTRITYPEGVVNENYIPMLTNEDTGTPTAGSWAPFLSDVLKNKPAMVKTNGELDYWLDPNDYTKKLDGTASDVSNTSYSGAGAFAWINKLYMKEVYDQDDNGRTVYFSPIKVDNDYYPVGFVDGDNNELDGIWLPMFYMERGEYSSPSLHKVIIRQNVLPFGTKYYSTIIGSSEFANAIAALSSRARFYGGPIYNVLRDLEYMLFKSTNLFEKAGYGAFKLLSESDSNVQSFVTYNSLIIQNGPVSGFYGTGISNDDSSQRKINKIFHSPVLGSLLLRTPNVYIGKTSGKIRYNSKYNFTVDLNDSIYSDSNTYIAPGSTGFCTRMRLVSKDYGSIPYRNTDEGATSTTGLLSCISDKLDAQYKYSGGVMEYSGRPAIVAQQNVHGMYEYDFFRGSYAGNAAGNQAFPIPIILPPASYDPN